MGPIIWTCLALTLHQAPVPEYFMADRGFRIPIKLDQSKANEIRSLILLYSHDQGKTWQQHEIKQPTEHDFTYRAAEDGSYWFIVQQLDHAGRPTPSDPERVKPHMAVVVDTKPPQIKVTAERLPSGQVRAHWSASELHPAPNSLRLEYQTSGLPEGQWTPLLPASPGLEGSYDFEPGAGGRTGEVRVRVGIKDQAGNPGQDTYVLPATATSVAAPTAPAPNLGDSRGGAGQGSPFSVISTIRNDAAGQPNQLTSQQTQRPVIEPAPGGMAAPPQPPAELRGSPTGPAPLPQLPIASNSERTPPPSGSSFDSPANSPAVQIVKAREVRIDFQVGKVGPSGLGNADIYVTLDQGRTWNKMPEDVSISVLQSGDGRGTDVTGSVAVQLPAEAKTYGFIVAAKSKAGRAPPPPKAGDPPQAVVEWDATAPNGQLYNLLPDANQPNTIILAWKAEDRNFGDKPIALEWAEELTGRWYPIGEGPLPNSGQYAWRLPERLPARVYLRMTMRDKAGNEARAQTDKPQLIDLSVPQTKIISVAPVSR